MGVPVTISLTEDLYTAHVTATGGRAGRVTTDDGLLDVELAVPKEMGGPGGAVNPEQLFAAGYAACFQGALGVVGRQRRIDTSASTVTAEVTIGKVEGGTYGLKVTLHADIPGADPETARELVEAADAVCPYSNAVRGNVEVTFA
jgi:osmotically inducible protein OsmC